MFPAVFVCIRFVYTDASPVRPVLLRSVDDGDATAQACFLHQNQRDPENIEMGLETLEALAACTAGRHVIGDEITMAECFLAGRRRSRFFPFVLLVLLVSLLFFMVFQLFY